MGRSRLLAPLVCALVPATAPAADFPPISERDRTIRQAPGDPTAPAVVLFRRATLKLLDPSRRQLSSRLEVVTRVKVLTEEGRSWGEVSIPHSEWVRLTGFKGRTVLPSGRAVPVPSDAKFRRKVSEAQRRFATAVAFPSVEPGAILDYRYELLFDSMYFLEPWVFSDRIPVLESEIVFHVPAAIRAQTWTRRVPGVEIRNEIERTMFGKKVRVWAENVPAVPREPLGLPFADLSTQFMLVPTHWLSDGIEYPLLDTWPSIVKEMNEDYAFARGRSGDAARRAGEIVEGLTSPKAKAAALFEFVRDAITTEEWDAVARREGVTVGAVLSRGTGVSVEKALLLEAMLEAAGIGADLVWAAERSRGRADLRLPNPNWFSRALVAAEVDGERVLLDPSDRAAAFGRLSHDLEGTPALVLEGDEAEEIVLPDSSAADNRRYARLRLELEPGGGIRGTGELTLTGHRAVENAGPAAGGEERTEAWREWLSQALPAYSLEGVTAEPLATGGLEVAWSMSLRSEHVVEDEASLAPCRPLGPFVQPLVLPASRRGSPLVLDFPYLDELELDLSWPVGWKLDAAPAALERTGGGGKVLVSANADEGQRKLVYRRRLELGRRQLDTQDQYEAVRVLLGELEGSDAQSVVLVRP